jgi:hypothetical protein
MSPLARLTVLVPLLALAAAGQAPLSNWDTVRTLASGTEVRIDAGKSKVVTGKLDSVTESAVLVNVGTDRQTFDRAQVASISVRKSGHRVRNTFIGLGVGLAAGLGIGAAAGHNCTTFLCGPGDVIVGGIVGTAGGTVAGVVWPTGGWRKVYQR